MIPKRALAALFVVAAACLAPAAVSLKAHAAPGQSADYRQCVVYVTRKGDRYHVDGCRCLARSRIPMSRRRAVAAGYSPCAVCGGSACAEFVVVPSQPSRLGRHFSNTNLRDELPPGVLALAK
jgi:hypothetical protein